MTTWYWCEEHSAPRGPATDEEVLRAIEVGQLSARGQVCLVGESRWKSVTEIPRFRPAFPSMGVGSFAPAKSRMAYILLGLFFGGLGIHNFYAGYTTKGIIQLVILLLGGWLIAPACVIWLWNLVEVITITKDANGVPFS